MFNWLVLFFLIFFKQKTAYEMRISDWSSDVCSSDLTQTILHVRFRTVQMLQSGIEHPLQHRPRHFRKARHEIAMSEAETRHLIDRIRNQACAGWEIGHQQAVRRDRKSTRLNSSH